MKRLTTLLCFAMSLLLTFSCGLMEMDEEVAVPAIDMRFDHDTIYVMRGEAFTINPVFKPADVSLNDIYWTTSNDTVVYVSDNTFFAVNEGWATVSGMSVSHQNVDSCHVRVLPVWDQMVHTFPYETVIYADVKVDGRDFDPQTMVLSAYVSGQVRGVGQMLEAYGRKYMRIRVGSNLMNASDNPMIMERIYFWVYDKVHHTFRRCSVPVTFDGETHGSLSNLYKISF